MIVTSLNELPEEWVVHNHEIKKKVMLRFGDLPHLTNFSQARFAPGQTAAAHAHQDMCEVFFVVLWDGPKCPPRTGETPVPQENIRVYWNQPRTAISGLTHVRVRNRASCVSPIIYS